MNQITNKKKKKKRKIVTENKTKSSQNLEFITYSSAPKKILNSSPSNKNIINNNKDSLFKKNEYIINKDNEYKNGKIKILKYNNSEKKFLKKKINNKIENLVYKVNNSINQINNDFTNEELNLMNYEDAIKYDKRTYLDYYWSLLKKKQLILFALVNKDDYNLMSLKIILLFLSFSLYLTINCFFFSDSTMHVIYKDNGYYNIFNQIPIMIYSTLISTVINMIFKKLSLSQDKLLKIKKEKNVNIAKEKSIKMLSCLKIQFLIFFTISLLFMLYFWYFISCFCAVYINTQKILFADTSISFGLSMLYPFGLNLLPGLMRIPALREKKKDKKCLYKMSTIVSLI